MSGTRRQALRAPSRLWPFKARDDFVTVVDLGAQKVACAIVSFAAPRFGLDAGARNIRVLGCATVRSSGFSAGRISNVTAAETSVRRAVAQAEAQAGVTAGDVIVTGQFEGLGAQIFEAKPGGGRAFMLKEDAAAIAAAVEEQCLSLRRQLLHMFTIASDGNEMQNLGGMGAPLAEEVDVAALSMPMKGYQQIVSCFRRSMLTVRSLVAGPVATALAVTDSLERTAGVLAVDMGAECTGYALFTQGVPVAAGCIGSGGQDITDRIARTFALRKFEAERTKIRYGGAFDGLQADADLPVESGGGEPISKFALNHHIRSNASHVFRAINERLKDAGYSIPTGGAVLAGGGSLLPGMRELASYLLACEVRTAAPIVLNGLSGGNALAALVGACLYASRHQSAGEMRYAPGIVSQDSSYASRISQWLRASFL